MINFHAAQVRNHRRNIERYCRLLATYLTALERQYLHKRIAEEHAELARLKEKRPRNARRLQRKQTTLKSVNILHACEMRGSLSRTDVNLSNFLM